MTGLCGMVLREKQNALEGSSRAEIRLGDSLCLENLSVFSVSADP